MIDHMNLPVSDLARSAPLFAAALAPLGLVEIARDEDAIGFGGSTWEFGLVADPPTTPIHIAFSARSQNAVDAFHKAALEAGGVSNGAPGLRPEYGTGYYAAYFHDPDGHNIEAVFRGG